MIAEKELESIDSDTINRMIAERLKVIETEIERLSSRIDALERKVFPLTGERVQPPTCMPAAEHKIYSATENRVGRDFTSKSMSQSIEIVKPKNAVGEIGRRKIYQEILDYIERWGFGKEFKLKELSEKLGSSVEGWNELAEITRDETTRVHLSYLKNAGKAEFSRKYGTWRITKWESEKKEMVEPRIVLMKNKSFAIYKEVIDYILKWGKNRNFTLGELAKELESAVAGWGMLESSTLKSYASVHLRYLKEKNQAVNIFGERAWTVGGAPYTKTKERIPQTSHTSKKRKVLGYVRHNPIHEDLLAKIVLNLKNADMFTSKDVRGIIDAERREASDETRRCLTYAYLKYLESNKIANKTEKGYKITNAELVEKIVLQKQDSSIPSLFDNI